MKKAVITSPFIDNILPFQRPIYDIAKAMGFCCEEHSYIPRWFHFFLFKGPFNFSIPFFQKKGSVRIQFVSGTHPQPMMFPYTYRNEIIPLIWDCWPSYVGRMVGIFKRCNIEIAFFSSKQTANFFQKKFPEKKMFFLPEAINTELYHHGPELHLRSVDVLEYGRLHEDVHKQLIGIRDIRHVFSDGTKPLFESFDDLTKCISDSKVVVCYPRSVTHPQMARGIETLTQRYWECMFSGAIIVGKAPKELVDILGYNPVIEANLSEIQSVVRHVIANVSQYQELSKKNMENATKYGDWKNRFSYVEQILNGLGYELR